MNLSVVHVVKGGGVSDSDEVGGVSGVKAVNNVQLKSTRWKRRERDHGEMEIPAGRGLQDLRT